MHTHDPGDPTHYTSPVHRDTVVTHTMNSGIAGLCAVITVLGFWYLLISAVRRDD